jgi:hypothetical protein
VEGSFGDLWFDLYNGTIRSYNAQAKLIRKLPIRLTTMIIYEFEFD